MSAAFTSVNVRYPVLWSEEETEALLAFWKENVESYKVLKLRFYRAFIEATASDKTVPQVKTKIAKLRIKYRKFLSKYDTFGNEEQDPPEMVYAIKLKYPYFYIVHDILREDKTMDANEETHSQTEVSAVEETHSITTQPPSSPTGEDSSRQDDGSQHKTTDLVELYPSEIRSEHTEVLPQETPEVVPSREKGENEQSSEQLRLLTSASIPSEHTNDSNMASLDANYRHRTTNNRFNRVSAPRNTSTFQEELVALLARRADRADRRAERADERAIFQKWTRICDRIIHLRRMLGNETDEGIIAELLVDLEVLRRKKATLAEMI